MYLFGPYSSTYSCPLAMTDGAARLIELSNDDFLKRACSPDLAPSTAWSLTSASLAPPRLTPYPLPSRPPAPCRSRARACTHISGEVYPRLITRDPKLFWTSGQWMTERPGGSDISRTETAAVQNGMRPAEHPARKGSDG